MPSKQAILDNLSIIANEGLLAAVAWHVLIASVLLALFVGWRPTKRSAALLLVVPLLSVSLVAATYGNQFNTFIVGAGAFVLLLVGKRLPRMQVARGTPTEVAAGICGIAVGLAYPHFLTGHPPAIYLVAAPVGLLPCPTLAAVVGFALLAGGFRSRAWATILATLGLFYGIFGAFRLEVWLDFALLAVALILLGSAWLPHRSLTLKTRTPPRIL